ncbi:hypothetical protein D3C81_2250100 [compost metagenome]
MITVKSFGSKPTLPLIIASELLKDWAITFRKGRNIAKARAVINKRLNTLNRFWPRV